MNTSTVTQPQSEANVLLPTDLASVANLFLLDPSNRPVIASGQHFEGSNSVLTPVLLSVGGLVVFLLAAFNVNNMLWIVVGGFLMLLGLMSTISALSKRRAHPQGTLLRVQITAVSARERTQTGRIAAGAVSLFFEIILGVIIALITNSSTSTYHTHDTGANDSYELSVEFSGTTPAGTPFTGKAAHNRPDLRNKPLPSVGDPAVVRYVSENKYALL